MTPEEDEAFNEIERQAKQRKESVQAAINTKEEATKLFMESYDQGVNDALESVIQAIKELRPAIKPLEGMGRSKTTQEWVKALPEADRAKFFRQIMAVVDAGRLAGVPPEEWAKTFADTYKNIEENL